MGKEDDDLQHHQGGDFIFNLDSLLHKPVWFRRKAEEEVTIYIKGRIEEIQGTEQCRTVRVVLYNGEEHVILGKYAGKLALDCAALDIEAQQQTFELIQPFNSISCPLNLMNSFFCRL